MAALPGGFLHDAEEDITAAARRELAEEAGLDANTLHLEQYGVYGNPGQDPRGRVVSLAYLAISPRLPEPVAGTDAAGARWVPVEDALSSQLSPPRLRSRAHHDRRRRAGQIKNSNTPPLPPPSAARPLLSPSCKQVYEAVWGIRLNRRNFYRKIQGTRDFVIAAGPVQERREARRPQGSSGAVPGRFFTRPCFAPPARYYEQIQTSKRKQRQ